MRPGSTRGRGNSEFIGNLNATEYHYTLVSGGRIKVWNKSDSEPVYVKSTTHGGDETTNDQFIAPGGYEIVDAGGKEAYFYSTADEAKHMLICEVD